MRLIEHNQTKIPYLTAPDPVDKGSIGEVNKFTIPVRGRFLAVPEANVIARAHIATMQFGDVAGNISSSLNAGLRHYDLTIARECIGYSPFIGWDQKPIGKKRALARARGATTIMTWVSG